MPDCHAKERTRPALPWGRWVALPHGSGVCIWVSETGVAGRAGAPGRGTTQTHRATFLRTALPPRGHCNRLRSPLKRQNQSVPLKTESHRLPMDGGRRPRSAPRSGRARPCGHAGPWEAVSTAWRPLLSQGTRGAPKRLPAVGGPHGVFPPANPGAQRPGLRWPSPGHGAQNARPPHPRPRRAAPREGQRGRRQRPGHDPIADGELRSQLLGTRAVSVRRENQWEGSRGRLGGMGTVAGPPCTEGLSPRRPGPRASRREGSGPTSTGLGQREAST